MNPIKLLKKYLKKQKLIKKYERTHEKMKKDIFVMHMTRGMADFRAWYLHQLYCELRCLRRLKSLK